MKLGTKKDALAWMVVAFVGILGLTLHLHYAVPDGPPEVVEQEIEPIETPNDVIETAPEPEVTCVVWEDSTGYAETWIDYEEVLELVPAIVTSCGLLVYENETRIVLAMDLSQDGYYAMISSIPKGFIRWQALTD